MKPGLTVLIPVFNEEGIIRDNTAGLLDFLQDLGEPFELIIVSNGSTDNTVALGRELALAHDRLRFFDLPSKGVGRAFALGVRQASFDRIISVDMDLSIDLSFIPQALELLDDYRIVVGSKKMGSQKRSFWRKAGSTAFILTARVLLGLDFEDYSIAAKAYHREVALKHLDRIDHGTSYVLDIIYHTLSNGGRAVEVPVHCEDFRPSKFNLVHEALYR
ncbi:MAG: glycosyltransferase family 2 protein, partial [Thermodesulfobacteriota bacterium]|nr:glycosyltransferase family 2 protein [Thermodesulfobacteriota bacterium]